ncbi:unnamed protein product [Effrenium voratum]|uniref:Nucleotide-diphospho-sugar transferase domain-containing protein n=1 Tax=Effrenium voratum TaxID=2562239 RepID=A0AA36N108_9DINO|nr:unnamed protein product [Effrenium voratum]
MKAEGREEADIKKQMEVLNDTLTVIPDSRHRLQKYATELRDFLESDHQDVSLADADPEVQAVLEGRQVLREVDLALGTLTVEDVYRSNVDLPASGAMRLILACWLVATAVKTKTEDFVVLTMLSSGPTLVNVNNPKGTDLQHVDLAVGQMDFHELFANWYAFLPPSAKEKLHVLCLDDASLQFARSLAPHADVSVAQQGPPFRARLEFIRKLLGQGKTVLQSDVDAVWLQDPLPYLRKVPEHLVAMREFTDWHEPNAGFILYRPQLLEKFLPAWSQAMGASSDDNTPMRAMFQTATWRPDLPDTSSSGELLGVTLRLLPLHLFARVAAATSECTGAGMIHNQANFQKQLSVKEFLN